MWRAILLLLPFTALSMGAVRPWAFSVLELAAFGSTGIWMVGVVRGKQPPSPVNRKDVFLIIFVICLAAMAAFQLLPLPPAVLRVIAPASYNSYREGLPNWPHGAAYQWVPEEIEQRVGSRGSPTEGEVRPGTLAPSEPVVGAGRRAFDPAR